MNKAYFLIMIALLVVMALSCNRYHVNTEYLDVMEQIKNERMIQ